MSMGEKIIKDVLVITIVFVIFLNMNGFLATNVSYAILSLLFFF